jgi:hypothetical protein
LKFLKKKVGTVGMEERECRWTMNYEEDIAKVGRWTGRRERKSVDGRWIMKMIYFPFVFIF